MSRASTGNLSRTQPVVPGHCITWSSGPSSRVGARTARDRGLYRSPLLGGRRPDRVRGRGRAPASRLRDGGSAATRSGRRPPTRVFCGHLSLPAGARRLGGQPAGSGNAVSRHDWLGPAGDLPVEARDIVPARRRVVARTLGPARIDLSSDHRLPPSCLSLAEIGCGWNEFESLSEHPLSASADPRGPSNRDSARAAWPASRPCS